MAFVRNIHDTLLNKVGFSQFPAPFAAAASSAIDQSTGGGPVSSNPNKTPTAAPMPQVPKAPTLPTMGTKQETLGT